MKLLVSLLAFTMISMLLGKTAGKKGPGWYTILVIVTVAQVAVIVYQLFIMEPPTS